MIPSAASTTPPRLDLRANASAALAAVLLGASVVAARVAVREVPPLSLAVLRFGQAFLLLAAAMLVLAPDGLRVERRRLPLLAERRSGLFVLGFAAVLGGVLLVNWPTPNAARERG